MESLTLIDTGSGRIELAYIHHAPKNPEFESKIKRGFHGRFGNKFQIPNYLSKRLHITGAAGGSNGARWARQIPSKKMEPHIKVPKPTPPEVFGKGGTGVPHAVEGDWRVSKLGDLKRGEFIIHKSYTDGVYKVQTQDDPYGPKKTLREFNTEKEAIAYADGKIKGTGAITLPPYKPPKDVDVGEPDDKHISSAGLLLREKDGRIWLREPSNHFGGYMNTFAKGRRDVDESPQQAAHREMYEESGLKGNIVAYLGDYAGDTSITRMYLADRTGGEPTTNPETWGFKLVTPADAYSFLNRGRDLDILSDYIPNENQKWLVKHYNGNENRVATELLANSIYRAMGVPVPPAGITQHEGRTALTYPAAEGEMRKFKKPSEEVGNAFMVDALLANWDVIGLEDDNILWPPNEGPPIRLDQGGTLEFRAMGGPKDFGPTPEEVWTMPAKSQTKRGMSFTPIQKREQASRIYQVLTPEIIDHLVDQAPYEDQGMKERVRQSLKDRVNWMGQFGRGLIDEKQPALTADGTEQALLRKIQEDIESNYTLDELANMKDKALHPTSDIGEILDMAQSAMHEFKFLLDMGQGVEDDLGAHVHDVSTNTTFDEAVDRVKSNMADSHIIIAPMKTFEAASQKVNSEENQGDWSRITDFVRATVLVPHPANISTALASVKKYADEHGWTVSEHFSKLYYDPRQADTGPTKAGYRDYAIRLQDQRGFQIELQFNWNGMFIAKQKGHKLYEDARAIKRGAAGISMTPEQKAEYDRLNNEMKELYDSEWQKVIDPMNVKPDKLADIPSNYFQMTPGSQLMPLSNLVSTKSEADNMASQPETERRMWAAASGKIKKRKPLKVRLGDDGKYHIIDGNATFTAAKRHGFSAVPVQVVT